MTGQSQGSGEVPVGPVYKGPDGKRYWVKEPEPILFNRDDPIPRPPDYALPWYWAFGASVLKPQQSFISVSATS